MHNKYGNFSIWATLSLHSSYLQRNVLCTYFLVVVRLPFMMRVEVETDLKLPIPPPILSIPSRPPKEEEKEVNSTKKRKRLFGEKRESFEEIFILLMYQFLISVWSNTTGFQLWAKNPPILNRILHFTDNVSVHLLLREKRRSDWVQDEKMNHRRMGSHLGERKARLIVVRIPDTL